MEYTAQVGRLFKILGNVDYLDIGLTTLAENYQERAIRVKEIENREVYVLSREDIIVTKIGRYSVKDKEDITQIIKESNKVVIADLIAEVIGIQNLRPKIKQYFEEHVTEFRRNFDV